MCKFSKLQDNSLAFVAGLNRVTDEGCLPEIAQYNPYYLPLNVYTASNGSNLYILLFECICCVSLSIEKKNLQIHEVISKINFKWKQYAISKICI